jgi:STE24 endopeptidase
MKLVLAAALLYLTTLFVITTLVDFPSERERARHYFSDSVIQKGRDYAARGRWFFWGSTAVHLGYLTSLVFLGYGRRLTGWAGRLTGHRWLLTLVTVTVSIYLIDQILKIPFRLAILETARQYGMSTMTWQAWFEDFARTVALGGLLQTGVIAGLYLLIAWLPRAWWIVAGFLSMALACLFALVLPVWINPLFNDFRPLKDPTLERNVLDLAERAGVAVSGVLVIDASRRTRHTNAYFTGFGETRRIVLYDTLLREPATNGASTVLLGATPGGLGPLSAITFLEAARVANSAEVTSVLAHEIGHWKNDHIVKGIALAGIGAFIGLFVLSLILSSNVGQPPLYLNCRTDPAGVALLLLLFSLGNWLVMPVENAVSREFERQADWTALELTSDPQAFIAAEKNLAKSNLGNVAPNPISQWFFSTHPTAIERIEAAEHWRKVHAVQR